MRFVISFFYCTSLCAHPIYLSYEGSPKEAQMYKEILMKDYQIPEDLISMKKENACENLKTKGKFDLCLKNNGDLFLVSVDREFISDSLKVFRAP